MFFLTTGLYGLFIALLIVSSGSRWGNQKERGRVMYMRAFALMALFLVSAWVAYSSVFPLAITDSSVAVSWPYIKKVLTFLSLAGTSLLLLWEGTDKKKREATVYVVILVIWSLSLIAILP